MGHSVRHQDFRPFAVIRNRSRISDRQRLLPCRRRSDCADRRNISIGVPRKHGNGVVSHIRNDEFPVLSVHKDSRGVLDACPGTLDHTGRSRISTGGCAEDENRVIGVIGHKQLLIVRVVGDIRRPVQTGLRPFNDAQGARVAVGIEPINRNGRWIEATSPVSFRNPDVAVIGEGVLN
jgi:hypothetical protein